MPACLPAADLLSWAWVWTSETLASCVLFFCSKPALAAVRAWPCQWGVALSCALRVPSRRSSGAPPVPGRKR